MTNPETRCPNCQHDQHLPGTECGATVGHGPNRWHLCLCLARPGAALPCPPQMTCQGGTLGYSDVWYLQQGHLLVGEDGEISSEALVLGVAAVGFPTPEDAAPAAVSVPPPAPRADDLSDTERQFLTFALDLAFDRMVSDDGFTDEDEAALAKLRRLADEAQQRETLCGRTTSVTRTEHPPCARSAGHPEAYCRSADGKTHFLALYGPRPAAAVSGPCVAGEQQNETPEAEGPVIPCSWAATRWPHRQHDWAPQPGMDPVNCPGYSTEAPS